LGPLQAAYTFDLSNVVLTSIERIVYNPTALVVPDSNLILSASQFGAGISLSAHIDGSSQVGQVDTLTINMDTTTLNLSGLVFTNFTGTGEVVTVVGSDSFADSITGSSVNDIITGGAFDDTLTGGDGNDTLEGDGGND